MAETRPQRQKRIQAQVQEGARLKAVARSMGLGGRAVVAPQNNAVVLAEDARRRKPAPAPRGAQRSRTSGGGRSVASVPTRPQAIGTGLGGADRKRKLASSLSDMKSTLG